MITVWREEDEERREGKTERIGVGMKVEEEKELQTWQERKTEDRKEGRRKKGNDGKECNEG